MTFGEWFTETSKNCNGHVTRELVKEILVTAIRTAIEEFLANPADASLDIKGIGRFYLNRLSYNMAERFHLKDRAINNDVVYTWQIHFKPSRTLKAVLNNKKDIKTVTIGSGIPLYTDNAFTMDDFLNNKKNEKKQLVIKHKVKQKIIQSEKKQIKAKLPED